MFERRGSLWSVLTLLVAGSLLVTACTTAPGGQPVGEADPNGELTTNTGSEPDSIDPHKVSFDTEIAQVMMVFEGLMALDPKTLGPVPGAAAKDPEISADGLKYTYTLRDGLKFSDGAPLTAKDFAYGFTRTCDPATAGDYAYVLYIISGCEAWNNMNVKKATPAELAAAKAKLAVKVTSDKQIEFTLTDPAPYFASITALWVGMPAQQALVTKGGDKWTEPATYIGNGPFKLVEWKHNEKLVFERNANFRLPVKLKKWTKVMINEGAVSFAAYRNNELDAQGLAAEDLRAVDADAELKAQLRERGALTTFYWGFNVNKAPFTDPNVRLAFAKSFDRAAWINDIQKIGRAADGGFIPPGMPGYDPDDKIQKFDPAEAKKLLDQASPAARDALKTLKLTYGSSARTKTRIEWVQAQWKTNLGVDVQLDPIDGTTYSALLKKQETTPQIFLLGWGADYPDPQNWLPTVFGSKATTAGTGYKSKAFDDLTNQADKEKDPKKRLDLYQQASRLLSKDAPAAWLYYVSRKGLLKPWVKGVTSSSLDAELGQWKTYEIFVTKH